MTLDQFFTTIEQHDGAAVCLVLGACLLLWIVFDGIADIIKAFRK